MPNSSSTLALNDHSSLKSKSKSKDPLKSHSRNPRSRQSSSSSSSRQNHDNPKSNKRSKRTSRSSHRRTKRGASTELAGCLNLLSRRVI